MMRSIMHFQAVVSILIGALVWSGYNHINEDFRIHSFVQTLHYLEQQPNHSTLVTGYLISLPLKDFQSVIDEWQS